MDRIDARNDRLWLWIGIITVLGLALRIAGAQGALWLDEAWSAKLAHDAGTPLGVFLSINHDNNHHLNSLWLQFVGLGAPAPLARALSIVTGTLAVPVAALVLAPRGPRSAVVAALLFAVSPILVTLGSEARGYAPMTLALVSAVLMTDRRLRRGDGYRPALGLTLAFVLGLLSQLTMLFGIVAVVGWYALAVRRNAGWRTAAWQSLRLFAPALIGAAAVLALIFGAAAASPTGFQFGSYEPFDLLLFLHGVIEMIGYTVGLPWVSIGIIVATLIAVIFAPRASGTLTDFHRLAICAFPLTLALLHAGNVGHPRYYLVAGLALLLLLSELIDTGVAAGGGRRAAAAVGLAAVLGGSALLDADLFANRRADPGAAIRAMRTRAPAGAAVILDRDTGLAMLEVAAAHDRYPLTIVRPSCPPRRFLFLDRFKGEAFPRLVIRCGARYEPFAAARATGLSGTHWTLYERRR